MKVLTCAATRRRLDAYHDEELSFSDQIAVSSHLEWCDDCAEALDDLRRLRDALRQALPGRVALSVEQDLNLQATVVNRIKAEERLSFSAWLQEAFADMVATSRPKPAMDVAPTSCASDARSANGRFQFKAWRNAATRLSRVSGNSSCTRAAAGRGVVSRASSVISSIGVMPAIGSLGKLPNE